MRKIAPEVIEELVEWFTRQKNPPTLAECMEHSGISRDSVIRYLGENGLRAPVGTRAGSSRGPYKKRKKATFDPRGCIECGDRFTPNGSAQRYCDKCGGPKRHYENYIQRHVGKCPCGQDAIPGRKYCSDEHRIKYGWVGRPPNPPITFTCLGCAQEFTIPGWKSNRKRKYCSNECAKREQKKGWGKVGVETPDGVLVLRSMYELRFVAVCERHGWDWRNYDGPAFETPLGKYRPDFVVEGEVVEVKGWVNDRSRAVRASAREAGVKVRLVDIRLLERLEDGRFT